MKNVIIIILLGVIAVLGYRTIRFETGPMRDQAFGACTVEYGKLQRPLTDVQRKYEFIAGCMGAKGYEPKHDVEICGFNAAVLGDFANCYRSMYLKW